MNRFTNSTTSDFNVIVLADFFSYITRSDFPSYLSLQPSLSMFKVYFISRYISVHSLFSTIFGSELSCYHSIIHCSSLRLLTASHSTLIFYLNSLMLYCGYLPFSILSRLVYLL